MTGLVVAISVLWVLVLVLAVAVFADLIGREAIARQIVVIGNVLRHLQKPLEIGFIAVGIVDNEFLFGNWLFVDFNMRFIRRLFGGRYEGIAVGIFQAGVIDEFLIDAVLQRHDRQLQNFHGLDHPRSQLHLLAHLHRLRKIQLHGVSIKGKEN